eukprot:GHVH01000105.1.p1 GENE.GHVH01000105.1~~GHVH01000105.1.p1  ORF type:complete len:203 (+),score=17.57 GHVH01000105.1:71-610(+)
MDNPDVREVTVRALHIIESVEPQYLGERGSLILGTRDVCDKGFNLQKKIPPNIEIDQICSRYRKTDIQDQNPVKLTVIRVLPSIDGNVSGYLTSLINSRENLKYQAVQKRNRHKSRRGIPQNGDISPESTDGNSFMMNGVQYMVVTSDRRRLISKEEEARFSGEVPGWMKKFSLKAIFL